MSGQAGHRRTTGRSPSTTMHFDAPLHNGFRLGPANCVSREAAEASAPASEVGHTILAAYRRRGNGNFIPESGQTASLMRYGKIDTVNFDATDTYTVVLTWRHERTFSKQLRALLLSTAFEYVVFQREGLYRLSLCS